MAKPSTHSPASDWQALARGTELVLRTSHDGFCIIDLEGRLREANEAYCRMTGYSREELLGLGLEQLDVDRSPADVRVQLQEIAARGHSSFEARHRCKDGSAIDLDVSMSLAEFDGQRFLFAFLRDSTVRKRAEQALRESEERYRQMFAGNQAMQWLIDPESGQIVEANPAAAAFYGYPLERLLQMRVSDINTMSAEEIGLEMQRAKSQQRSHFYFRHRLATGQERDVEVHSSPVQVGGRTLLYSIIHDVSERKQAEEALRHSEAQLRLVTDSLPARIAYIDAEQRYRFNNKAYEEWFGCSTDALVGKHVREVVGEVGYAVIKDRLEAALGGRALSFEDEILYSDGRRHHIRVDYVPDLEPGGRVKGVVALINDTTERAVAELELRESEARLAEAQRIAHLGDWDWEFTTDQLRGSDEMHRILGLPLDVRTISFHDYLKIVHPEDRHQRRLVVERVIRERTPFEDSYRIVRRGEVRYVHVRGAVSLDEHGNPRGLFGVAQDVTVQREAERELRESEAQLRLMTAQVPAVLWTTDAELRFTSSLGKALEQLGLQPNQVVGMRLYDYFGTDAGDNAAVAAHQAALRGEKAHYSYEWNGVTFESYVEPLFDNAGTIAGTIGVALDISDRVQAQRALDAATAEWTYAMDFLDDALYLTDRDDHVVRANRAFYHMVGLSEQDVVGRDIKKLMHPHGGSETCPVCLAHREHRDGVFVLEPGDPNNSTGQPLEIAVNIIGGTDGDVTGALVGIHDLTRTRQTETELRRLNSYIGLLLESAGEGIYGVDRDDRCTFINHAALEMLGYKRSEVLGRDMHRLVHHTRPVGGSYAFESSPVYLTLTKGENARVSNELMWRGDGHSFPAEYSSFPIIEDEQVSGAVVVFRDVAEAQAMVSKMDYLATHDTLTGLVNRHEFERRLERALEIAHRDRVEHTLCYMDLDQFKVVNDTCGHVAGDELLRQLGLLFHGRLRKGDTLARLGGDEFGVLLEGCPQHRALAIVNDLRQSIHDYRFVWEDKTFAISISVGLVGLNEMTESLGSALSQADTACYVAKDSGRNRVHVYQVDDAEMARRHGEMHWVSRIQDAIEHDRFVLRYQPIVPLQAGEGDGLLYEILISMIDADGATVPPGAFLPAAERYNLVGAIDRWVVRNTFAWFAAHPEHLQRLTLCTINLSGHTLADDQFLGFVVDKLGEHDIPTHKICFEITETAAIANMSRAVYFIGELTARGCRFALDDFGSGMSSFAYLKNLPVDFLKIDGNFVRDIVTDPVDRAMVEAINQVGHVMQIRTVAEHAENEEVLTALRSIGVDFAQGYGIAAPRPLSELDDD